MRDFVCHPAKEWKDKILKAIEPSAEDESVRFVFSDGKAAVAYHQQDCCETVSRIAGNPVQFIQKIMPSGVVRSVCITEIKSNEPSESATVTVMMISVDYSTLVFAWLGESNGYYSEGIDFRWE